MFMFIKETLEMIAFRNRLSIRYCNYFIRVCFLVLIAMSFSGCKKLVTVEPPTNSLTSSNLFNSDVSAASAISNIYVSMNNNSGNAFTFFPGICMGLAADELTILNQIDPLLSRFYSNSLEGSAGNDAGFWTTLYNLIYQCNISIEKLEQSTKISAAAKSQFIGECKFFRAFFYFYLVNLYGDCPLILSSNYVSSKSMERMPKEDIYKSMIEDLLSAQQLLPFDYSNSSQGPSNDHVRPNQAAATALLSRIYLYHHEWAKAEEASTQIIDGDSRFSLATNLDDIFIKNSSEAILQIQPVFPGYNSFEAPFFIPEDPSAGLPRQVALSGELIASFESGDARRASWVGEILINGQTQYYPTKYKVLYNSGSVDEYEMILRLTELYFIRAESRAELDNMSGALSDLNQIRDRSNLSPIDITDKNILLDAILTERRHEFFTEWGNRWLDLKRTEKLNATMEVVAPSKGAVWESFKQYFPIPDADIAANHNLTQTSGY